MDCVGKIKTTGLDDFEAEQLLVALENEIKAVRAKQGLTPNEVGEAVKRLKKNTKEALLIQKRNALINAKAHNEVSQAIETYMAKTGVKDPAEALKAINVGTNDLGFSSRLSVDAKQKGYAAELTGEFVARLREKGYLDTLKSNDMDSDIAEELFNLDSGKAAGSSGNKAAGEIAEIIHAMQQKSIQYLNDAGAWLKNEKGYIIKQSHDQVKMSKAGFDKWKEKILPLLDMERMRLEWGVTPDTIEEFLEAAFNNITIGKEFKLAPKGGKNPMGLAFQGPSNLAKSISAERVLHFKGHKEFMSYHGEYGNGGIAENVLVALENTGHEVGLLETWGTNPQALFERVSKEQANKFNDKKIKDRLSGKKMFDTHQWYFDEINGESRKVGNLKAAHIGAGTRAIQSMAKLGGSVITSFADLASQAAELRHHGVGYLESYGNALKSLVEGKSAGEKREILDYIGVGLHGLMGGVHSRYAGTDTLNGKMSKLMDAYFKLNLLTPWTDAHKSGVTRILSHNLARNAKTNWKNLNPDLKKMLGMYDIDQKGWDILRTHTIKEVDGKGYMTTDFRNIPDDVFKKAMPDATSKQIDKYKTQLERNLRTYFMDSADYAIPTPGAKERALLNQGTMRGTALGEAVRFFMQFKAFPVTYISKAIGREAYSNQSKGQMAFRSLSLATGMTAMGYLALATKDMFAGKEPRNPMSGKVFMESFVQGGGAGIVGDILFKEYNRYGQSPVATFLGPTVGSVDNVMRLYGTAQQVVTGEKTMGDLGEESFKIAKYHMPAQNLFYTKLAVDMGLMWHIQEAMNAGFAARLEQRAYEDYEQEYFPLVRPTAIAQ